MIDYLLVFVAGLLVGWNLVPQPHWVAHVIAKVVQIIRK
jgi:hypothetical protein